MILPHFVKFGPELKENIPDNENVHYGYNNKIILSILMIMYINGNTTLTLFHLYTYTVVNICKHNCTAHCRVF